MTNSNENNIDPFQINPNRVIQLLSEKVARLEVENAAYRNQIEQAAAFFNNKKEETTDKK